MDSLISNNQSNRKRYEKPEIEFISFETGRPSMEQTSYHYQGAPDD